jgi:hypothetical protein
VIEATRRKQKYIHGSKIQVAVSSLQGLIDGLTDLAGGRLPGAESQLRDLVAGVQSDLLAERHLVILEARILSEKLLER